MIANISSFNLINLKIAGSARVQWNRLNNSMETHCKIQTTNGSLGFVAQFSSPRSLISLLIAPRTTVESLPVL